MPWREEFNPDFDVPSFVEFLVSRRYLEDFSWHNDVSPSFGFAATPTARKHWDPRGEKSPARYHKEPEIAITLWVDHPMKSHREVGGKRFTVMRGQYGHAPEDSWEFDELEEALKKLFTQIIKHGGGEMVGSAWSEIPVDTEPEELLNQLEMEYHSSARG